MKSDVGIYCLEQLTIFEHLLPSHFSTMPGWCMFLDSHTTINYPKLGVCFRSYVRFSLFIWRIAEDSCAGSARDLTRKKGSRAETDKFNLFAFFSNFVTAELLGIRRG